jgi:hypothetical protein
MQLRRPRNFAVIVGPYIYFPRDTIYVSMIFFKFAPAGKNLFKV